jgi:hypothetical protein
MPASQEALTTPTASDMRKARSGARDSTTAQPPEALSKTRTLHRNG